MRFKHFTKVLFLLAVVFSWLIPTNNAEAVPAFARQMGVPCNGCHFQYFPKLNSFGREFKLGGFTQTAQELIEDDGISLPPVLNAAFYAEIEFHQGTREGSASPKEGVERGEWKIPAEGAIFFGGRVAENMGALVEFGGEMETEVDVVEGEGEGTNLGAFKFVYSADFGGVQGGVSVFSTKSMGPGYGMEGWNTGAQMHIQSGLNMMVQSALSSSMLSMGEASGITLFASTDMIFVAAGLSGPVHVLQREGGDLGLDFANYFRLAVTPQIGEWDAMIGIVATAGSAKCVECVGGGTPGVVSEYKTSGMAIDAQMQGDLGNMSLGAYLNYVLDMGDDVKNIYAMGGMRNNYTAMSLNVDLGVTPKLTVHLAYWNEAFKNMMKVDRKYNAMTLGVNYLMAQNVQIILESITYGGDTDKTEMSNASGKKSDMIFALKIGF